jgi:hypothetical protein
MGLLCLYLPYSYHISFSFISLCRLFQVTWLKNDGFIYDRHNFSKVCCRPVSMLTSITQTYCSKPWITILKSHLIWVSAFLFFMMVLFL